MKERVKQGEVTEEGTDDVLTKVLGKPEHGGRVRGQGTNVTQTTYFKLPRQRKKGKSIEDRIQEGIHQFMKEETSKIIQERDLFWANEMAKLKAAYNGKNTESDCSPVTGSQQGSCSHDAQKLDLQGARKKLDILKDDLFVGEEKQIQEKTDDLDKKNEEKTELEKNNEEKTGAEPNNKENWLLDIFNEGMKPQLAVMEYELAIDSTLNIVAYATVDTKADVVHGKAIEEENARVSITRAIQGSAKIPFPIKDEIETVEQAVGTYISWPRHLIIELKPSTAVNGCEKVKFSVI